jgi:hypothetical protein
MQPKNHVSRLITRRIRPGKDDEQLAQRLRRRDQGRATAQAADQITRRVDLGRIIWAPVNTDKIG